MYEESQTNNYIKCILNYEVTFYVCALLHLQKNNFNYICLSTFAV